jgi:hypothetical protein
MGLVRTKYTVTSYGKFYKAFNFKYDTYFLIFARNRSCFFLLIIIILVSMWVWHLILILMCTALMLSQEHVILLTKTCLFCYSLVMFASTSEIGIQLQNG